MSLSSGSTTRSLFSIALVPLLWSGLQILLWALPRFFVSGSVPDSFGRASSVAIIIGTAQVLIWIIIEALVYRIAARIVFRNKHNFKLLRVLLTLVVAFYLLWVGGSWFTYFSYHFMPGPADFWSASYLLDTVTIREYLHSGDLVALATAVILALLSAHVALRRSAERVSINVFPRCEVLASVIGVAMLMASSRSVSMFLPEASYREIAALISNSTTPQGPLLADLFYHAGYQTYHRVPLSLRPSTSYKVSEGVRPKKNVMIIAVEALRYDALNSSALGYEIVPTIDRLSREGVSFTHAYAQATDTEYSLSTILSGLYPLKFPRRDPGADRSYPQLLLSQLFKQLGYRTSYLALFDWKGMRERASNGFDRYSDPTADGGGIAIERRLQEARASAGLATPVTRFETLSHLDDENVRRLKEWIDAKKEQPFFSLLYLYSSHFPYVIPSEDFAKHKAEQTYYFPPEERENYHARYLQALHFLDARIADLVAHLDEKGMLSNTLIIITGDHGEEFYEHGGCLHAAKLNEEVIHVPLILYGTTQSCTFDPTILTGHVDIAPTLLDILGLKRYLGYQGQSMCHPERHDGPLFSSSQAFTEEDAVLMNGFKYVRNYRGERSRLFNLREDPQEQHDLLFEDKTSATAYDALLEQFRNQQLSYYSLPHPERDHMFPPQPPQVLSSRD